MTTKTFADITLRQRSRSNGVLRNALNRLVDVREQQARRFIAEHLALRDSGFPDALSEGRASLFESRMPERR